ncbi:MAG: hypothetical protein JXA03_05890 [Bacteroidales bacterium]|nr:hypothetical protein [Bacteroidales bacterium]
MKTLFVICNVVFLSFITGCSLYAQGPEVMEEKKEQLKAHRIAFITERLRLTPEEAQRFWPVYNQHEMEREEEMKSFRKRFKYDPEDIPGLTDQEAEVFIDARLEHEQKLLDLRKKYNVQLKEVLSPQKIVILYEVENEFRKELLRKLGEFQDRKRPGPGMH